MKPPFAFALVIASFLAAAPRIAAQAPNSGAAPGAGQSQPAASQQNPPAGESPPRVKTQSDQNPFPDDTSSIPVMPNANSPALPPGVADEGASGRISMPAWDLDPVRSPEDAAAAEQAGETTSSSSLAGLGNLLPPPDDIPAPGRHNRNGQQVVPEHRETAAEDESVGNYYLDEKNWKAALSRFQSALVLDPANPDVYWGLAESERHLGDFAAARDNYLKVTEYDPDSRHGKEARKALKDPEIANAKPAAPPAPAPQ
ncbi:MAG: tetratricopeptide repeat protein [Terracidiphilus sp.]